jgi:hypothetical protein
MADSGSKPTSEASSRAPTLSNAGISDVCEREKSLDGLDAPPDGGLRAWLQVLGAHITIFNTW